MRKGEGDDLPGIGGIGEDFLVAGHGGVEAHLADGVAGGAEADAFQHGAVGEHEQGGRLRLVQASLGCVSAGCFSVIESLNLGPRR